MNIAVIGLGYVGLPLALRLAQNYKKVIGFDINKKRVDLLNKGIDVTCEGFENDLKDTSLLITFDEEDLKEATFYIVCVPTPIDADKRPDLTPLNMVCETLGKYLKKGDIVVFESTVYPGVTEEHCGPRLEKISGLKQSVDFKLGYSPERMNPGDKERTVDKIVKVISAEDEETLKIVKKIYSSVVKVGIYEAESIKVAEAAKVIENTQRDINIALMNECALIFDRIGISTRDVLNAASTKWNFLKFFPGLVGGHCIGVDPYYLTAKAESLGYHPEVILAGRRINDDMGNFIAHKTIKLLIANNEAIRDAKIGIFGLTFKENVADLRNSRVPDIYNELKEFGIAPIVCDPMASKEVALSAYNINLVDFYDFKNLDALILAVPHKDYIDLLEKNIKDILKDNGIIVDVKTAFSNLKCNHNYSYWAL